MKRDHYYLIGILILCGAGFFGGCHFRKENRRLKQENEALAEASAMLLRENQKLSAQVSERDSFIIQKSVELDSLKSDLQRINNKGIVTNYESYSIVRSLDLRGQIDLLTRYISASDSIGN